MQNKVVQKMGLDYNIIMDNQSNLDVGCYTDGTQL